MSKSNNPKDLNWEKYKIRTCQSIHECALCGEQIDYGFKYYDGGYGRRAHVLCVRDRAMLDVSYQD
jgi:hypothetical protein